jgi:predicted porin
LEVVSATAGTLRMGTVNNEVLTATTAVAAPAFSTGVGSAYSSSWSTHDGYGTGVTGSGGIVVKTALGADKAGSRGIRQANTIKYISPKVMDVTFSYGMVPKNSTTPDGTADTVGVKDMSLRYTAGPLDVMYASLKYDVGAGTVPTNGSLTANSSNTQTITAVTYTVLPTLKLHAGSGKSKASDTALANSSSTQFGATYTMGAFDIMAQTAKVDNKNTTAYDRKMTGLGLNYNLSKTTRAYVRYDNLKLNDGAATAVSGDSIKRTAFGVSTSF